MPSINWKIIARWSEPELDRLDIAAANLLCALELPGAESISIDECRRGLDNGAARVHQETARLAYLFQRQPGTYQNSEARFRMMVLFTVLQRDFGIHADPELSDLSDSHFFSRAEHLFLHGAMLGLRRGTCSSLPPLFAAVGRRLGYPLKFVTVFQHVFLRWEGATGERFNVECTTQGLVCHPDHYYRYWPRKLTEEQERRLGSLQTLTPRQELSVFIGNRGHVLLGTYQLPGAVEAYAHASQLWPESSGWSASLTDSMNRWENRLRALMMPGFPPMTIHFPPRQFPNVPLDLEQEICHMTVREKLLTDPELDEKWWQPLRRDRAHPPPDLPVHIIARFPQNPGEPGNIHFANKHPDGYDPKNAQRA